MDKQYGLKHKRWCWLLMPVFVLLYVLLGICGIVPIRRHIGDPHVNLTFTPLSFQDTGYYFYSSPTPIISPDGLRVYIVTDKYWMRDGKSFPANEILRYQRATGKLTDTGLPMANIEGRFDRFGKQNHDAIFSANGRYVVYASSNPQHVTVERYGSLTHIYRKDLETKTVEDLTRTINGAPPNGPSDHPAISGDGKVVAFLFSAKNSSNSFFDKPDQTSPPWEGFYLRDLNTGQTEFVEVPGARRVPLECAEPISGLRLSEDGSIVVFSSEVSIVTKHKDSIGCTSWLEPMVYDRKTKKLFHIGITKGDHRYGTEPHVSADGRFVVFRFVDFREEGESSTCYLYDMQHHSIEQVGDRSVVGNPAISDDGRFIVFVSRTPNKAMAGTQAKGLTTIAAPTDIYLFDRKTRKTVCLCKENATLCHKFGWKYYDNLTPSISADGRYVCYAAHLAEKPSDQTTDSHLHATWVIMVYDRTTGITSAPITVTGRKTKIRKIPTLEIIQGK